MNIVPAAILAQYSAETDQQSTRSKGSSKSMKAASGEFGSENPSVPGLLGLSHTSGGHVCSRWNAKPGPRNAKRGPGSRNISVQRRQEFILPFRTGLRTTPVVSLCGMNAPLKSAANSFSVKSTKLSSLSSRASFSSNCTSKKCGFELVIPHLNH